MRTVIAWSAALVALVSGAVGLSALPASAAADRDCGDFASQRAAQIFYLEAGGPRVDPHLLDSDGDGVACETNPAPYYYGTRVPDGSPHSTSGGSTTGTKVRYVVDGDTIRLANGHYVRLIGIDTPERGRPYYAKAKRNLDRLVGARVRLVNPASTDDRDHYGRLLRYLRVDGGRDAGLAQIRRGYAHARYDSRDGYDWHPMQRTYRRADAHTRNLW
jgi:endonuclease YncB( thermonuclease family)